MFEKMDDAVGIDDGKVTISAWRDYIGASNKAIDHTSCDNTFLKIATKKGTTNDTEITAAYCLNAPEADKTEDNCVIKQEEFRAFWEKPEDFASTGTRTGGATSSGATTGVVVGCVVAAVAAVVGIGYFTRSRQSSAQDREMRVALSQDDDYSAL